MHKKKPEKNFKHACSLNLYMNRYLKIQEKNGSGESGADIYNHPRRIAPINLQ